MTKIIIFVCFQISVMLVTSILSNPDCVEYCKARLRLALYSLELAGGRSYMVGAEAREAVMELRASSLAMAGGRERRSHKVEPMRWEEGEHRGGLAVSSLGQAEEGA